MEIQTAPDGAAPDLESIATERNRSYPLVRSLRTKGLLFNFLLLAYIVFIVVFALNQRAQPLEQLAEFQNIQRAQVALQQADLAAFHIVTVMFSDVNEQDMARMQGYFAGLRDRYQNLQRWFPEQAETFRELVDSIPASMSQPDEDNLRKIQFHLARSKSQLDRLMAVNQERMAALVEDYQAHHSGVLVSIMALGIIGLLLLGGLISLFINQLKRDIQLVQQRADEIVEGYRGKPLTVHRNDEVGQLTERINSMANALAEREKDVEIQRNRALFVEKMAAIDSLAGGIAHEIGNPIAGIAGLVDSIGQDEANRLSDDGRRNLQLIKDYADGLVRLTRELSVFDTHKSDEFEWLDVNQLISSSYNLLHYDLRWSGIKVELELDQGLPAVQASMNQLSQLINNVLDNAREAVAEVSEPGVTIITRQRSSDRLELRFEDNGPGMDEATLARIFEPFFSTKPVGQGTGLGLAICWAIVTNHQGMLYADSTPGKGTAISVILPLAQSETVA